MSSTIAINDWIRDQLQQQSPSGQDLLGITSANTPVSINVSELSLAPIDNLTSTATNAPLSANQGKVLDEKIDDVAVAGSNANGQFVKFSDGTQICYLLRITTISFGIGSERNSSAWTYPSAFVSAPYVNVNATFASTNRSAGTVKTSIVSLSQGQEAQWYGSPTSLHSGALRVKALSEEGGANSFVEVFFAVGRWK